MPGPRAPWEGNSCTSRTMRCAAGSRCSRDRKSTRLNSSHLVISYAVFCLKKKNSADPPLMAEERGQAFAIADNLLGMIRLRVPIFSALLGAGGSGGSLALGRGALVRLQQY